MDNLTSLDLLKLSNLGEGEVISNPKIYVADFGPWNKALSENIAKGTTDPGVDCFDQ